MKQKHQVLSCGWTRCEGMTTQVVAVPCICSLFWKPKGRKRQARVKSCHLEHFANWDSCSHRTDCMQSVTGHEKLKASGICILAGLFCKSPDDKAVGL